MYFARAAAAFAAAGNLTSQGEALLHLADCKRVSGELAAAQELLGQALALPLSPRARLVALISRIWEAMALGDPTAARTALDNALTVMMHSVSGRMRYELVRAIHSPLLVLPGGAAWAERLLGLAEHWSVPAVSPMQTLLLGIDGLVRLFHGDLAGADMTLGRAVDLAAPSGATTLLAIDVGLMYAALPMFRGDMATANSRFSALLMLYRQPELAGHMRAWGAYHRCYLAWLRWHEGRLDEVRALAQELEDRAGNHEWPVALYVRHIVGWLCAATVDRNAAEQHLCAAEAELLRFPDAVMLGDVRVLRVWSALRQNHADSALALLITVLDDYAKRGVPGLLLLHGPAIARPLLRMVLTHDAHGATARQLLAAIGEAVSAAPPTPPTPAASVDDLTARERDVLAQIAAGAANGEIADQLVISPATVKKHINNLFAKLGARSRTQALARARERGLL
jgi:ATP/maltotriose-dependent transcriptional regulator MalT